LGDLKLVEKPQPVVLAPRDFCNIKANVKVASTENGIIFGNIGEYSVFCDSGFCCSPFILVRTAHLVYFTFVRFRYASMKEYLSYR
jgi:hypothetical protein